MPETAHWRHYAELHRPHFYRYGVSEEIRTNGPRWVLNVYHSRLELKTRGRAIIGISVVIGRFAYCVKWAHARMRWEEVSRG